jgi:drug/metabolite transporter (DMT)-like permease
VSDRARVWSALWTVYIVWGSTYLAIAVAVETIPPLFAVSTRFIAAGSIMALVVTRRGGTMRATGREIASCVLIGVLLPGANAVLFFAERTVPTGLASLLIASVPLWVVLLRLVGRERLPVPALVGVGVGFAGVAVLAQPSGGATAWGIGLCVLSSVMWSVGSVLSARLPMPADPFAATGWEMLGGGVAMLPLGLATMGSFSPSTSSILGWVYRSRSARSSATRRTCGCSRARRSGSSRPTRTSTRSWRSCSACSSAASTSSGASRSAP